MSLSLYVHIPFCQRRCIYCDFVSGIYDPGKEGAYIKALKKEILNIPDRTPFTSFYIGGGTPTVLSIDALSDLITHIFKHLRFIENYEATIEVNPGTLDKEKLQAIRTLGMNRISIGVQSFNDEELNFLGRLHSSHAAEQAVYLARDTGFENIGIDLIYGIPGQNIESWKKTLEGSVNLKPKHISTYELTIEKGTLLYEYVNETLTSQRGTRDNENYHSPIPFPQGEGARGRVKDASSGGNKLKPLEEEKIIEMYNYAIDYLNAEGFEHYEISNFALPDYFCRHNLNYWERGEYYGVGLGAHSFIKEKRFYNTDSLEHYIGSLFTDRSPVKGTEDIQEDKALSEALFLGLRKTGGINLKNYYQTHGRDIVAIYHEEIKKLREAGLLELKGDNIRLTRKGLLLSNEVFIRFM